MATTAILLLSLILLQFCLAYAQNPPSNITRGSSLSPESISSWVSPSGLYAFGFYPQADGYRLGIYFAKFPEKTIVWTANRDNPPFNKKSILLLTTNGKLTVRPPHGANTTIIGTPDHIYSASMLDSGNFVLYNSAHAMIWQSFDNPTDTILPGQSLKQEQKLISSRSENGSSSGPFCLRMQYDGNLVQYPVENPFGGDYSYWSSNTYENPGTGSNYSLNLDNNGKLYILRSSTNIKSLTQGVILTERLIFMMRIDVDGILRLYSRISDLNGNWSIKWESLKDKCAPKGLCGLNSYCVLNDVDAECRCLNGFDFVDSSNLRSGCKRNFTAERCRNGKRNSQMKCEMVELDNTIWENVSNESSVETKQDCKNACFEDHNCEVTSFHGGICQKRSLPLRYGRNLSTNIIIFIKVGLPQPISDGKNIKKQTGTDILIIGLVLIAFSFLVLVFSGIIIFKTRVWGHKKVYERGNVELGEDISPRAFTFAELEKITNGFTEEIGRGAFGTVYKGVISQNQKVVAVKRLEKGFSDGEKEFQAEIKTIGLTHHRNLVRLIGYCLEGSNRLLVYEYMSNGTLANLITRPENRMSWEDRIAIALDIARGIFYLHEECDTQIIHCDIKPQNILMDKDMRAKISDFGLAKLLKPDETKTYTGIRGTRGYVAPEWHRKMPVTVKADVYSYGVVLFEIICCRRNIDLSLPEEEIVLEEWVYDCFEANNLKKLASDEEVGINKEGRESGESGTLVHTGGAVASPFNEKSGVDVRRDCRNSSPPKSNFIF